MAELTENQQAAMRKLFEDNDLSKEDVFTHKHYVIIKRSGIEKIQFKNNISVKFESIVMEKDFVVVKAIATKEMYELDKDHVKQMPDVVVETYGEASPDNCTNKYYVAMSEKRALSRAVLKLMQLYKLNVYAEDENVHENEGEDV